MVDAINTERKFIQMENTITLDALSREESGTVLYIDESCDIRSRLNDMGVIKETTIKCVGESALGDPKAYLIRGSIVAIRKEDAMKIHIKIESLKTQNREFTLLLAGNPNVGKSTIFNELTGLNQHTGNWIGKTVDSAKGFFDTANNKYTIIDIPGTHSLEAESPEEVYAKELIIGGEYDKILVILDGTNLEHSLNLALQIRALTNRTLFCVNLLDEAKRNKIEIDLEKLSKALSSPTLGISAKEKNSKKQLTDFIDKNISLKNNEIDNISAEINFNEDERALRIKRAECIAGECIINTGNEKSFGMIDKLISSKCFGYPIMLISLIILFWLTIYGANYPSQLLSYLFSYIESILRVLLVTLKAPKILISLLIDGIFNMTARVIAVMLPPMAIFFPLFTLMEDSGFLPRIAFNLDRPFAKCGACGKQALTMCMGFGCNACGVTGARIINSPRERLLAIITNSIVPCNGKFPTIIAIITMFLVSNGLKGGIVLALLITICIFITFIATYLLSHTFLKGELSSYVLELPPFRRPQIGRVILRSVIDKTSVVLIRAVKAALPAGLIVWIVANVKIGQISLLCYFTNFLDPFASIIGLDGVILGAFILGIAANETVIPIMIMSYLSLGSPIDMTNIKELEALLVENGWNTVTALCTIVFTLYHWPCATTLSTISKEVQAKKWILISAILPTLFGIVICFLISQFSKCF